MKVNANVMNLQRSLKININPDKNLNKIDEFAIENKWEIISINFPKLLEEGKALISYQELYEIINDLLIAGTSHKYKESLENILKSFSKKAFENFIKISIKFDKDINNFFFQFNEYFLQIKENFSLIRKIFVKFEKVYYTNQITLWTICNKSFYLVLDHLRISLSSEKKFLEIMINNILFRIYEYRSSALENINIDLGEIKESVKFLWDTQSYKENFHELFLATSESFYNDLSQKLVSSLSIFDYISFVENSLEGETRLVLTYLYDFSLKKLVALVEKKSIIESKERILKKCFEIDDLLSLTWILFLKRVFLLFKKVKLDEEVKKCWMQYISFMSNKIFTIYSKNSKSLFDNLYELKRNIDLTLQEAFLSEEKFRSIAKEGFAKSINLKPNFIADHFSRYIDLMFKECDNEDKKIESNVDEFITIFKYLDAKDMFETFYIRKLSTRLLYKLTSSKKGEKYLIEKLRTECGSAFVNKSEEMLTDIEISNELTVNFTSVNFYLNKIYINEKVKFNFHALSALSWPIQKIVNGNFSHIPNIERLNDNFITFFKSKNAGRTLNWHLPYCSAELNFNCSKFSNKLYSIDVNGVQLLILMLFNQNLNKLSQYSVFNLNKIIDILKIEKEELVYNLNNLVNIWHILEEKSGNFKLNTQFSNSKHSISFNDFNKDNTSVEEIREVEERNTEDRKYVIDAYIMKLLKQKKSMKSNDLILSVIESVKFPCEVSFVNLRISWLVDRENIKKDEKDENILKYN